MTPAKPEPDPHPEGRSNRTAPKPPETEPRRLRTALTIAAGLLACTGSFLAVLGFFADRLGLDNDPGWGKGRIILTVLGLVSALCAILILLRRKILRSLIRIGQNRIITAGTGAVRKARIKIASSQSIQTLMRRYHSSMERFTGLPPVAWFRRRIIGNGPLHGLLAASLVIGISLWYITAGTMKDWPPHSRYYDQLGEAFLHGQLALLEEPSPELLALPNPYNWREREGVSHPWDVSLYNGKFYLYWGPVPALLAALVKSFATVTIEDQYLLFFFCSGMAILLGMTLSLIRQRVYPSSPAWTVGLFTLLGGLALPVLWLINRPSVYETAIAGGQFFLLMGLFFALQAGLRAGTPYPGWLAAAGLAWGAAVACRLNLALVVIFFSAILLWRLNPRHKIKKWALQAAVLILPLLLWAGSLAWYNYARFGSIFETGHRYQLTGPALPEDYTRISSPAYVIPNFYNYLLRPLEFSMTEFPPVYAPYIAESMWPRWIQPPPYYYYAEPVAGLLFAVPGTWQGMLPLIGLLGRFWRWLNEKLPTDAHKPSPAFGPLAWWMIAGGCIFTLAPLMVFISSSMRYLADATPLASALAALGCWWGLGRSGDRPGTRYLLLSAALILTIISISFSLLANFANGYQRFEAVNLTLYSNIADLFGRKP